MADYLLGIDVGTSACKAAVFDRNGAVIASETGEYGIYYPQSGYVEQKPEEWCAAIYKAIRNIFAAGKVKPEDIKSIGIDGHSWSAVCIDKSGEILFDDPIWMDTRTFELCEEVKRSIGEKHIFDLCGNPFSPGYTTPKIMWFKKYFPGNFRQVYKVLQSNSYVIYKLTGRLSQDLSQCYGLHFWDMRKNAPDKSMAQTLGIDVDLIPEVYKCHDIIGGVTREAAELTGLFEGTPVAAGGVDSACGTLGAGVITDGETQEQGGQSGGMSICCDEYKAHEKLILCNHVVPDKYLLQGGTIGGGASFKWLRENFFADLKFDEMDKLAEQISAGSDGVIYLPYMSGERSPIWNPKAKGVFYGFDFAKNKAHFIRAVMEGVAYSLQHNLKTAEESGVAADILYSNGGSANSDVWMQIKSDVTNSQIAVPSSDTATTLGAALISGVAVGIYKDFPEAVKSAVTVKKTYQPNAENHAVYQKGYETYREIYENLKGTMGK
jgi:xylulokinase